MLLARNYTQYLIMTYNGRECKKRIYICVCAVLSRSVMSNSLPSQDCSLAGSSAHGDSPGKNTGVGCHAHLHGLLKPGIKPRSATLQVDSLLSELPGKHKNIGLSSQSLLQEIFSTQELNPGLLHCRWILYQLSYQGSPFVCVCITKSLLLYTRYKHNTVNQLYFNKNFLKTQVLKRMHLN